MGKKKDNWPELCELVKQDDGLPTRDSGYWAKSKLYNWNRYIDITTSAMVGHARWPAGLVYVDLFAGPGVCFIRSTKERIPGSPIIAAHAPKPFRKILLCELDKKNAKACETRLNSSPAKDAFRMFVGDCNEQVSAIVNEIPKGALTLAFVDPTGLHAEIATIKKLASAGQVDLLILFPDAVDVLRNADIYLPKLDSNLDKVLGKDSNWRALWESAGRTDASKSRRLFAQEYQRQLKKHAGYVAFGEKVISGPQGPLYRLVFASKHEKGLEFWDKVTLKELSGQKRFL